MTFHIEILDKEFPHPKTGLELDEQEIQKCAKKLRKIISEKVGLNCDDYEITLLDNYIDEKLTHHFETEWDYKEPD